MQHKAHCHLRNKVVQCLDEAEISFQGCVRVWVLWICFIVFLLTLVMTNTREKVNWVDVRCKLLQANHVHLLGATVQCFFTDKYHQWDQSNMLATSKIIKRKTGKGLLHPTATFWFCQASRLISCPQRETLQCNKCTLFSSIRCDRQYAPHYTQWLLGARGKLWLIKERTHLQVHTNASSFCSCWMRRVYFRAILRHTRSACDVR